ALRFTELARIELLRRLVELLEALLLALLALLLRAELRDLDTVALRDEFHRLAEFEVLTRHHEVNHVPARLAAEAVVHPLLRDHVEARRLLIVEGAAGLELTRAGAHERNILADQLGDVHPLEDCLLQVHWLI